MNIYILSDKEKRRFMSWREFKQKKDLYKTRNLTAYRKVYNIKPIKIGLSASRLAVGSQSVRKISLPS